MLKNKNKMSVSPIEKNKIDSVDLLQMEYFSDLPISEKNIIVVENNRSIVITIRKFLTNLGFENIYVCEEANEAIKIFSQFISNDTNVPIIIDYGTNISIQNTVKELLEIQADAKIVITTTREKSDPGISRLTDTGISAIIYKPLIFEDIKKVFSEILKKNYNGIENTGQSFTSLPISGSQISTNKIRDVFKIKESEIEDMIKNAINSRKIILDKEVLEAACNQCSSTNINYTSECPQCGGINFKQQGLIEHYNCGEVYPKEGNYHICPKCNKDIGSVGTNYREFSEYHICSSCNDRFSKPSTKFNCLECGNMFIEKLVLWKKSTTYRVQK